MQYTKEGEKWPFFWLMLLMCCLFFLQVPLLVEGPEVFLGFLQVSICGVVHRIKATDIGWSVALNKFSAVNLVS